MTISFGTNLRTLREKRNLSQEGLARMRFLDRRGSGFDKIVNGTNRLFDDQENHVEFYATETHFSVVIYNANYRDDKVKLSDNTEKILNAIINKPSITRKELAEVISKKESTVNRAIRELKDQGYIAEKIQIKMVTGKS